MRAMAALFLVVCGIAEAAAGDGVTVSERGEARAVIVVAQDDSFVSGHEEAVYHAARELSGFLHQVTGGAFPIVDHPEAGRDCLFVGPHAARLADPAFSTAGLGTDGIVIRAVAGGLILAGGEPRGTLYAVYTFLEDHVGCHWWTPTESTIPSRPTLTVPSLDIRHTPPFEYRSTCYMHARDPDYSVRNKLNGHEHRLITDPGFYDIRQDVQRGGGKYSFPKVHLWAYHTFWLFIPPEIYLAEHPEWFAAVPEDQVRGDGVYYGIGADGLPRDAGRTIRPRSLQQFIERPFYPYPSLCLTNEAMRKELVRSAKLALLWHPITSWLSVSQTDGMNPCRCETCMAVAREEGAYSGLMVRFINAVAEDLSEWTASLPAYAPRSRVDDASLRVDAYFPSLTRPGLRDLPLVMEAYHYTRKPPKRARPRDDVIVLLATAYDFIKPPPDASWEVSHGRPVTAQGNAGFREDFIGWSEICNRLYIWYYLHGHGNWLVPFPNLRAIGPDLKFFAEHGVRGLYGEAVTWSSGAELAELRAWLWAKLLWDPDADAQQLIAQFCNGYYGPAGKHILGYLETVHDAMEAKGKWLPVGCGQQLRESDAGFLTLDILRGSWSRLEAAELAVKDDPALRFRVQVAQLPVLYTFMMRWDPLRQKAKDAAIDWPLPESVDDVYSRFMRVAKKKDMRGLAALPAPPGRAFPRITKPEDWGYPEQ